MPETQDLWAAGEGDYHTYRIPALTRSTKGTLLAFCEGRRHGRGDSGEIDLLVRRSEDGGATWDASRTIVTQEGMTCGNPCPVVDAQTGTIWLPLTKNIGAIGETMITQGKGPRTVWLTKSDDDGVTWAEPVEITGAVKNPAWTWYATGPGHGIQLRSGRLLVACDHMIGVYFDRKADPYHSHVITSDDHGATWHIGATIDRGTNECAVAEVADGRVYINCRNYVGDKRRAAAWSSDGGESFHGFRWHEDLVEPICQAGLIQVEGDTLAFTNPASTARERMTARVSRDGGETWSPGRVLHEGPAAYSDLVVEADGGLGCLYECGEETPYERLRYARFDLGWIEG